MGWTIRSFDTSHVTVQPKPIRIVINLPISFHTSHVTVQQKSCHVWRWPRVVSIHPMLLFNCISRSINTSITSGFHTSHVTVQPTYLSHFYFLSYHKPLILQGFSNFCPVEWHFITKHITVHWNPLSSTLCKISTNNLTGQIKY